MVRAGAGGSDAPDAAGVARQGADPGHRRLSLESWLAEIAAETGAIDLTPLLDSSLDWLEELDAALARRRSRDGLVMLQSVYAGACGCISEQGGKVMKETVEALEQAASTTGREL